MFILVKDISKNGKKVLVNVKNIERVEDDYSYRGGFYTAIRMITDHDRIIVNEPFDDIMKKIQREIKKDVRRKNNRFELMDLES